MPSPTELSSTILDALIEWYGSDVEADVFTDAEGEQLAYLIFSDGDRYIVRIAATDDYPADRQFIDENTGAHALITSEELRVYTSVRAPAQYHPVHEDSHDNKYMRYPLEQIQWVSTMSLPGGQTAVAIGVSDTAYSPGLTFSCADTAVSFKNALDATVSRFRRAL